MEKKYGIEEIKKVVLAGAGLLNIPGKVMEDGKIDWTDLVYAPDAIEPIKMIISIDVAILKQEWSDLDAEERKELADSFDGEFDIPQDQIEEWVEATLDAIIKIIDSITEAVAVQVKFFKK